LLKNLQKEDEMLECYFNEEVSERSASINNEISWWFLLIWFLLLINFYLAPDNCNFERQSFFNYEQPTYIFNDQHHL